MLQPASVAERAAASPLRRLCGATYGAAPLELRWLGRLARLRWRGRGLLRDVRRWVMHGGFGEAGTQMSSGKGSDQADRPLAVVSPA